MGRAERDDAVHQRLDRLGYEGLQEVTLDRKGQTGQSTKGTCVSGDSQADFIPLDGSPRGLDTKDASAAVARESNDLALLNDIDTELVGSTRITPDNGVVPRGTGRPA